MASSSSTVAAVVAPSVYPVGPAVEAAAAGNVAGPEPAAPAVAAHGGADDDQGYSWDVAEGGAAPSYALTGDFFVGEEREIPASALEIDSTLSHGQIRPLSKEGVLARMAEIRSAPPLGYIRILVWMPREGAQRFIVLGGQHSVEAIRRLREELVAAAKPLPPTYTTFVARVVKPGVPLRERQLLAGDHQVAQSAVRPVPLSQIAVILHQQIRRAEAAGQDVRAALVAAIHMSGRPRPGSWKEIRDVWGPFAIVVGALGERSAGAVEKLELSAKGKEGAITLYSFRNARSLLTPEFRAKGCQVLLDERPTVAKFDSHVARVAHEQWVSFHWRSDNPHIAPERRVFPMSSVAS